MSKISSTITMASLVIGMMATAMVFIFTLLEMVFRSFLGMPLVWASDFSSYALCVIVSFTMPFATREGAQIAVTLMLETLPTQKGRILLKVTEAIAGISCLAIAALCIDIAIRQFGSGVSTVATVPIEKWIISAMLAYGFTTSGLMHLARSLAEEAYDRMQILEGEL